MFLAININVSQASLVFLRVWCRESWDTGCKRQDNEQSAGGSTSHLGILDNSVIPDYGCGKQG